MLPTATETMANSFMAIFGLQPRFKVLPQDGHWWVQRWEGNRWIADSGPWESEGAAIAACGGG